MSPLRDSGPDDPVYNVAEDWVVKVAYGLAAALHALRAELIELYSYSDEPHQVGGLVLGLFGLKNTALRGAADGAGAASILRNALVAELHNQSCQTDPEDEIRKRVVAALTATTHSRPFDPFGVLFDDVRRRSKRVYGDRWPAGTRLFFERIADRPFPGDRYWLSAITDLHLGRPTKPPSVHLRIHPTRLNFATYGAIYAVLVHECVCHVAAHREPQRNESPFAEGFCDWAAQHLFERWTEDRDADAALSPPPGISATKSGS